MAKINSTRDFYVYVHRRATDGRVFYVGKGNGRRAWATQGRSNYWRHIVAKHGYTVDIVQNGMQEWWAFELEIELIAFYKRESLCNLTDGGDGCSGAKRSAETIAKTIAIHIGKKRSAESCKRMSDAQKSSKNRRDIKGDKNPAKREEVKAKMRGPRESLQGDKNPMNKPETKAKFLAIVQSSKYKEKMSESVKVSRLNPNVVQKHKEAVRKSYENPERKKKAAENMRRLSLNPEYKERKKITKAIFYQTQGKKVLCLETGIVFRYQQEAVNWLKENGFPKATATRLSEVIKMRRKTAYGFTWRHA